MSSSRTSRLAIIVPSPLVLIIVLSALAGWSCGKDGRSDGGQLSAGTIVTLVGRGLGDSEGQLRAFDQSSPEGRELLSDAVDLSSMTNSSSGGPFLAITKAGAEGDVIQILDTRSGETTRFASGSRPATSQDRVAYCDEQGGLIAAPIDDAAAGESIATVARGCASMAWRGNQLAFLQLGTSAGRDGITVRVWNGAIQDEFEAPIPVRGYGPITWSALGRFISYSNDDQIVEIDLLSKQASVVGAGTSPKYSPTEDNMYVALSQRSAEVRSREGEVITKVDLPAEAQPGTVAMTWSPDGEFIAIATASCIHSWAWRTGEFECVFEPQSGSFLPVVLWLE